MRASDFGYVYKKSLDFSFLISLFFWLIMNERSSMSHKMNSALNWFSKSNTLVAAWVSFFTMKSFILNRVSEIIRDFNISQVEVLGVGPKSNWYAQMFLITPKFFWLNIFLWRSTLFTFDAEINLSLYFKQILWSIELTVNNFRSITIRKADIIRFSRSSFSFLGFFQHETWVLKCRRHPFKNVLKGTVTF